MKSNKKKIVTYVMAALMLLTLPMTITAASVGSADNPLISLEYVNNIMLPQLQESVTKAVYEKTYTDIYNAVYQSVYDEVYEEVKRQVLTEIGGNLAEEVAGYVKLPTNSYTPIFVEKGQKIQAVEGESNSCELILSSGTAQCFVLNDAHIQSQVGLRDSSTGIEVLNGDPCPYRHYIIIPRGDGRGVEVTSEGGAYFLVRGDYEVVS